MNNHDAVAIASATIQRHSKSFALASRLLPPGARAEVVVLYHWCRRADDAIDLAQSVEDGRAALRRLAEELDAVYSRRPVEDPVLRAFQDVVQRREIPFHYPKELLAGMAMDLDKSWYRDLDDLMLYCYRVAGTVGLMMSHVLGVSSTNALSHATHLGMAMQLTNICRDVLEDWDRGRVYLPESLLRRHGAPALHTRLGRPLSPAHGPALAATVADLLKLADEYYASADQGLPFLSWRAALAVRTARKVYAAIGGEVRRKGCDVFAGRAYTSGARKLRLVLEALSAAALEAPARAAHRFQPAALRRVVYFSEEQTRRVGGPCGA